MVAKTKADAAKTLIAQALKGDKPADKQVAGAWGVEKFDNGYVTGMRIGNTVYVDNPSNTNSPISRMLSISEKLSPGVKFILNTGK